MTMTPDTPCSKASDLNAITAIRNNLNNALRGKAVVVERVLQCILARGHLLLEDLPGLGKTTLAKALADSVGGRFARVQCTPDLMPGDITGFSVFNQKTREFEFLEGPVFSDILLADEINRTTPRTQSALLEAMAECQVTVDNHRYALSPKFMVIATQNPVEHHGTYPLPEAQLDRFAMKLSVGYPDQTAEIGILASAVGEIQRNHGASMVVEPVPLEKLQNEVACISVGENVQQYLVKLAGVTRKHSRISLGLSPRGLLIWQRVAQARAFLRHRSFVTPDDIQDVAQAVLQVRMGCPAAEIEPIISEILATVPVPV
ncbi:MAG: AAA family ATPase [Gemmataceae bacterium]